MGWLGCAWLDVGQAAGTSCLLRGRLCLQGHLFAALRTTRLVPAEASWQELRYSRGGRTDKGVSGKAASAVRRVVDQAGPVKQFAACL